jgi:hypothetical protein
MSNHKLSTKPLNASLKTLLKRSGHIGLGISTFTPVADCQMLLLRDDTSRCRSRD